MPLLPPLDDDQTAPGARATLEALREQAPRADVLHLACHGQFRPDNPLFSSLRLTGDSDLKGTHPMARAYFASQGLEDSCTH